MLQYGISSVKTEGDEQPMEVVKLLTLLRMLLQTLLGYEQDQQDQTTNYRTGRWCGPQQWIVGGCEGVEDIAVTLRWRVENTR